MNTQEYKIKLEEEKKLLESELSSIGRFDKENNDWQATTDQEINNQEVLDEADIADRSEDYGERYGTVETLESRLKDIKSALEKIENNNYGKCEECGKDIEEDRLNANPSSRKCKICIEKVS